MHTVTESLGGYQNIVMGVIQPGDLVTFQFGETRMSAPADDLIGMTVEDATAIGLNVYRKLDVPRQGGEKAPVSMDVEHGQEVAAPCPRTAPHPDTRPFIPQGDMERKHAPMFRGLIGYFPAALFEVAAHSFESDQKHNPGNTDGPHWNRGASSDHADCVMRHLTDAGVPGTHDRKKHLRSLAWRALALLQEECEREGFSPGVSSRFSHGPSA
jgi:hypothetical protein